MGRAQLLDNCQFFAQNTGTGDFSIGAIFPGAQSPAAARAVDTRPYHYSAMAGDQSQWEYGIGRYHVATTTLERFQIVASTSGGNAKVNFTLPPVVAISPLSSDFPQGVNAEYFGFVGDCIVQEGPDFFSSVILNKGTNNAPAWASFNAFAQIESKANRGVLLHFDPGGCYGYDYSLCWQALFGIQKLHINGHGAKFQNIYDQSVQGANFDFEQAWPTASTSFSSWPGGVFHSIKINTTIPGSNTFSLVNPSDMQYFAPPNISANQQVGQRCAMGSMDIMFFGYPPNPYQFEYPRLVGFGLVCTIAAGVVTCANHSLQINSALTFSTNGTLPSNLVPGTTYYVVAGSFTTGSFMLSATVGGAPITDATPGSGTHAITNIITMEQPIRYQHRADFPDYNFGAPYNAGAARVWPFPNDQSCMWDLEHVYQDIKVFLNPNHREPHHYVTFCGRKIVTIDFDGPGPSESVCELVHHIRARFRGAGETDKMVSEIIYEDTIDSPGFVFQSPIDRVSVRGGKLRGGISGMCKQLLVTNADVVGINAGGTYGMALSHVYDNCRIYQPAHPLFVPGPVDGSSAMRVNTKFVTYVRGVIAINKVQLGYGLSHFNAVVGQTVNVAFNNNFNSMTFSGDWGNGVVVGMTEDATYIYYTTTLKFSTLPQWAYGIPIGCTISLASPAVVSSSNHYLSIDDPVILLSAGVLPSPLVAGRQYYVATAGYFSAGFQLAVLPTGASMVVTIPVGSPATIGFPAHGLQPNDPIYFTSTGTLPAPLVANTTYYVIADNLATDTFEVSATPGGAPIATTSAGTGTYYINSRSINTTDAGSLPPAATCQSITQASPAVVNCTAHGLAIGAPFKFSTTGGLPAPISNVTQYYVLAAGYTSGSFQFSRVPGGPAVNTTTAGSGTHTVTGIHAQYSPASTVYFSRANELRLKNCYGSDIARQLSAADAAGQRYFEFRKLDFGGTSVGAVQFPSVGGILRKVELNAINNGSYGAAQIYVQFQTFDPTNNFQCDAIGGYSMSVYFNVGVGMGKRSVSEGSWSGQLGSDNVLLNGVTTGAAGLPVGRLVSGIAACAFTYFPNKTACAISIATPAVVSIANHGFVVDEPIFFTGTATLPAPIVANQVYYVISAGLTTGAFQFSATKGGAAVATTAAGSGTYYVGGYGVPASGLPSPYRAPMFEITIITDCGIWRKTMIANFDNVGTNIVFNTQGLLP
jgi:hypothetical protein